MKYLRGIAVYDRDIGKRVFNKPFLHNEKIDQKDRKVNGNLRKCIRLLKSIIYDEEEKNALSSYDITSIIHCMPEPMLAYNRGQELQLIKSCNEYLNYLLRDQEHCISLSVPNGTRKIFCTEGASLNKLRITIKLLQDLLSEIEIGLSKSFRKLADARIRY